MPDTALSTEKPIQTGEVITYWLDCKDTIIEVSQAWNRFAQGNQAGAETLAKNVIGKSVFSFVIGDTTRMYLQVLLQQPRIFGRAVSRKYRCDSPEIRRYMEMRLTPESGGLVRLDHIFERQEPFKQAISFHPAPTTSAGTLFRCSICARLQINSCWIIPEDAVTEKLLSPDGSIPVTYLVCPVCQAQLTDKE